MKIFNSLKVAFAMYSKIPTGRTDWSEENLRYSMCFVPLVGFVIGITLIFWHWIYVKLSFNDIFYGCTASLIPLMITGGIHMDGYIDVMDALSSYGEKEKKLEILKDPHVGAFAVIWAAAYMIAMAGIFSQAVTEKEIVLISLGFVLSRAVACLLAMLFQNARKDGTLYTFTKSQAKRTVSTVLVLFIAGAGCACFMVDYVVGFLISCVFAVLIAWFYRMVRRDFGGMTGDMAGFLIQVSELFMAFTVVIGCRL